MINTFIYSSMRKEYIEEAVGWVEVCRVNKVCHVYAKICPEHTVA